MVGLGSIRTITDISVQATLGKAVVHNNRSEIVTPVQRERRDRPSQLQQSSSTNDEQAEAPTQQSLVPATPRRTSLSSSPETNQDQPRDSAPFLTQLLAQDVIERNTRAVLDTQPRRRDGELFKSPRDNAAERRSLEQALQRRTDRRDTPIEAYLRGNEIAREAIRRRFNLLGDLDDIFPINFRQVDFTA